MRGRKPKPIEQRVKEGNAGKRPLPQPVLVGGRPEPEDIAEPPDWLPVEGQEFWRGAIPQLAEIGIVDMVDTFVLEQLAVQYARFRQAQRVLKEDGHFVRGSVGQLREHPALKIEREATSQFLKIAEHYALTPVARVRLGMAELVRKTLAAEMDDALGSPDLKPAGDSIEGSLAT